MQGVLGLDHYEQHFEPFFGFEGMRLASGHYEQFSFLAI